MANSYLEQKVTFVAKYRYSLIIILVIMVMGVKHILKKNTQYYNEKIEIPNKEKNN